MNWKSLWLQVKFLAAFCELEETIQLLLISMKMRRLLSIPSKICLGLFPVHHCTLSISAARSLLWFPYCSFLTIWTLDPSSPDSEVYQENNLSSKAQSNSFTFLTKYNTQIELRQSVTYLKLNLIKKLSSPYQFHIFWFLSDYKV